jgi:cysteine desulfurase/selenocysteine lyase
VSRDRTRVSRQRGVPLVVDGAQAAGHAPVDVRALACDFFACSGHKMLGPPASACCGRDASTGRR